MFFLKLKKEIDSLSNCQTKTVNSIYGNQGKSLEIFNDRKNYNASTKELRPLDRHLPQGWKKKKMDPKVLDDPYDELKDMFKKKK